MSRRKWNTLAAMAVIGFVGWLVYFYSIPQNEYYEIRKMIHEEIDLERVKQTYEGSQSLKDSLHNLLHYLKVNDIYAWPGLEEDRIKLLRMAKKYGKKEYLAMAYRFVSHLYIEEDSLLFEEYSDSAMHVLPDNPILKFDIYQDRYYTSAYVKGNVKDAYYWLTKAEGVILERVPWEKDLLLNLKVRAWELISKRNQTRIGHLPLNDKELSIAEPPIKFRYYLSIFYGLLEDDPDSARTYIPKIVDEMFYKDGAVHWGNYYKKIRDYQSGIDILEESIAGYDRRRAYLSLRMNMLAEFYYLDGRYDLAQIQNAKARQRYIEEGHEKQYQCDLLEAKIEMQTGATDSAIAKFLSIIESDEHGYLSIEDREEAYTSLIDYYESTDHTAEALSYRLELLEFERSIWGRDERDRLLILYFQNLSERLDNNLKKVQDLRVREHILFLVIGALVFIVAVVFIEFMMRLGADRDQIKQLNLRLEQQNNKLEKRVLERTRALDEKNKELKKSNAILRDYAFVNSHHLRAPLCAILGIVYVLGLKESSAEEQDNLISMLDEECKKLDDVVHEIQELVKK